MEGAAQTILQQLQDCHLVPDEAPVYQTRRRDRYARALTQLVGLDRAYACGCSRKDIEAALQARHNTEAPAGLERTDTLASVNIVWSPRAKAE